MILVKKDMTYFSVNFPPNFEEKNTLVTGCFFAGNMRSISSMADVQDSVLCPGSTPGAVP